MRICLFFILACSNILAQDFSFSNFVDCSKKIEKAKIEIKNKNFESALTYLNSIENLPYGLIKSFYLRNAEVFFKMKDYEESTFFYTEAFKKGVSVLYLTQLKDEIDSSNQIENSFYKTICNKYDSIKNTIENESYLNLKSVLIQMYQSDQETRRTLLSIQNDSIAFEQQEKHIIITDSINQMKWDSLLNIYGWIRKDMLLNFPNNIQIVLYHSSKETRNKNLKNGIELAKQNKIDWNEVVLLFSYHIFRDCYLNENSNNKMLEIDNFDEDYLKLFCYSLTEYINNRYRFNDKLKFVEVMITTNNHLDSKISKIQQYLKEYQADETKYKLVSIRGEDLSKDSIEIKIVWDK